MGLDENNRHGGTALKADISRCGKSLATPGFIMIIEFVVEGSGGLSMRQSLRAEFEDLPIARDKKRQH